MSGKQVRRLKPIMDRFWGYVRVEPSCWRWVGCRVRKGYGQFSVSKKRRTGAHRFAYRVFVGPIPDGLTIDHLCRNTWCVNPAHLEPVTIAENIRRAPRRRTPDSEPCRFGHIRVYREARPHGRRRCRDCENEAQNRWRAARREAA